MKDIPNEYPFPKIETQAQPAPAQLPNENDRIDALIEAARIDYSRELPPPPTALKIQGEMFGTLGNFSIIYGKAKSKKTFCITLAVAGALNVPGIFEGELPADKSRVIFADTEQGAYHVTKVAKRVARLAGVHDATIPNFEVFKLRDLPTADRLNVIEYLIQTTPDLGVLVIDGIRDLVSSINDEQEATSIADKLLQWTDTYQVHIMVVLHQNKGDKNARGHLGSELINKAETAVTVEVEPDNKEVSKVEAEYGRWKHFEPFAFMIDENGLPEVIDGWKPKNKDKAGMYKIAPDEIAPYQHTQILQKISRNTDKPKYGELVSQTGLAVKEVIGHQCGTNKAKEVITYWKNERHVVQHGTPGTKHAYYTIHPHGNAETEEKEPV